MITMTTILLLWIVINILFTPLKTTALSYLPVLLSICMIQPTYYTLGRPHVLHKVFKHDMFLVFSRFLVLTFLQIIVFTSPMIDDIACVIDEKCNLEWESSAKPLTSQGIPSHDTS
jgi:sorbitol-specific phosphotransferase system component IIC